MAMSEEQQQWWTLEVVMSNLSLPQHMIDSIVSSLPPSPSLPPHLLRRLLLRRLFSLSAGHLPPPLSLQALNLLHLLLPRPPSAPPPPSLLPRPPNSAAPPASLCQAYASLLLYIALCPLFSAAKAARAVNRVRNYQFAPDILRLFDGMVAQAGGGRADVRIASARHKAVSAVQEFVKEQFGIMEHPFFIRAAQAYYRGGAEQNRNTNEGPSTWHANERGEVALNLIVPCTSHANGSRTEVGNQETNGVLNVNDPGISLGNDGTGVENQETDGGLHSNDPGSSNANNRAHSFEWDEANEEARELERSSSRRERRASPQPMGESHSQPVRTRRPRRYWTDREVEVLIQAVEEFGESNWKAILDAYGDEFDDRTPVDLKDKWRNLGPIPQKKKRKYQS